MKKKLSLTVGITTCFGDNSMLDTVKSIRKSVGIDQFHFIIIADRTPINPWLKKELKRQKVELIENKNEASQVTKQRQMLKMVESDLILFTQDDVLLEKNTLNTVVKRFEEHPETSFISILNKPVKATNFFESCLNIGTNIANRIARYWNKGDNYLSVIGRFMIFRTEFLKKKIKMYDSIATSDAYYYFSTKKAKGKYEYIPEVGVLFKNPQNMKEHLRKSSRFQFSKLEMNKYFKNLENDYKTPKIIALRAMVEEFILHPIRFIGYMGIFAYTRILKMKPSYVLNAVWEVDLSTKKVI